MKLLGDISVLLDYIYDLIAACFVVEQIAYFFLGSYPYRCGMKVHTILLSSADMCRVEILKQNAKSLKIKASRDNSEIYISYKYPMLLLGPRLFIVQIKDDKLYVRIGHCAVMFLLFNVAYAVLLGILDSDWTSTITNLLIITAIPFLFYFRIFNLINRQVLGKL